MMKIKALAKAMRRVNPALPEKEALKWAGIAVIATAADLPLIALEAIDHALDYGLVKDTQEGHRYP